MLSLKLSTNTMGKRDKTMFIKNYKEVLLEYEKFWNRENTSRPILNLSYTKDGATPYRAPKNLEEKWLDESYIYNAFLHNISNIGFLAEGIPMLFTNFGPGCLTACIGGSYELSNRTIWFENQQIITDWEAPPNLELNEKSEMWQHLLRLQSRFATDPDIPFSITDLGGILDIIAALRGTETLLYDLYDYPSEIKVCIKKVTEEWFKAFDQQINCVKNANLPYNAWMNIPSLKPWYPLQCDFSYMIAPSHFEEFVLPHITKQVNYMDRSIYHLDGVGELPHLDMLLDIPKLTGIQWVPGAGIEPLFDKKWFDVYKKIQDKKKNLVLHIGRVENNMNDLERLIKELDPTGVYLQISCSSQKIAENTLEKIIQWSK